MRVQLIVTVGYIILISLCSCDTQSVQTSRISGEWIEITDVVSLPDIKGLSTVYCTWLIEAGLVINDNNSYQELRKVVDTSDALYHRYGPIVLPPAPDFGRFTLIGIRTHSGLARHERRFLVNDSLLQYLYTCTAVDTSMYKVLKHSQNWMLVPKLKSGYTTTFKYVHTH